jgi:hypothetical protein
VSRSGFFETLNFEIIKPVIVKTRFLLCCFWMGSFFAINAQGLPLSADSILREARITALKEDKNIFIIFHASWCGWCHKMDSSMNDKCCKQFFQDNYVIRHLVVHESMNKKNLESPGARELLTKYSGADEGIPFWLIFGKNGQLLADSQIGQVGEAHDKKGQNTGCPATPEEVSYFIRVLKITSRISEPDLFIIKKRFLENAD